MQSAGCACLHAIHPLDPCLREFSLLTSATTGGRKSVWLVPSPSGPAALGRGKFLSVPLRSPPGFGEPTYLVHFLLSFYSEFPLSLPPCGGGKKESRGGPMCPPRLCRDFTYQGAHTGAPLQRCSGQTRLRPQKRALRPNFHIMYINVPQIPQFLPI